MSIIEVKNIGKKYNITHQAGGYIALRDVLTNIFKNPFKFLAQKTRQAVGLEKKEEFWALTGVNFTVEKGEVVGIIGANGAGKSTLLKILSQITYPTTGEIRIDGRVGSLLEVGTGFHPELSGRENIFLNGAILGMTKKEIVQKFDEIVEFAGIEKFLDTPVKYYSSGMYVRLAFSVAAHMEPDILVIDEVLAVGDAEFQKKCLGKMNEITKQQGRTILFVSHNMEAIKQLCDRCVLLDKGRVIKDGKTNEVLDYYLNKNLQKQSVFDFSSNPDKEAEITKVTILNKDHNPSNQLPVSEPFYIKCDYSINKTIKDSVVSVFIFSAGGELMLFSSDGDKDGHLRVYEEGKYSTTFTVPQFLFTPGFYSFNLSIQKPFVEYIDLRKDFDFEILDIDNPKSIILKGNNVCKLSCILDFEEEKK